MVWHLSILKIREPVLLKLPIKEIVPRLPARGKFYTIPKEKKEKKREY